MTRTRASTRNKRDLIIEIWEALDCESIGATEIAQIQQAITDHLGELAIESPASIARTLADEGAVLRHPEILEFDTGWRRSGFLSQLGELQLNTIADAEASIQRLEKLRVQFGDEAMELLRPCGFAWKERALSVARSRVVESNERTVANEVAQWLNVWLSSPEIFADWLSLRRQSPDFLSVFSDGSSSAE